MAKSQWPPDFERETREQFDKLEHRELPFEQFLRLAADELQRTATFTRSSSAALPDGTPSVQIIPSGPISFGDIPPCNRRPSCVSREVVLQTRGAAGGDYQLAIEGVCFAVTRDYETNACFEVRLCRD